MKAPAALNYLGFQKLDYIWNIFSIQFIFSLSIDLENIKPLERFRPKSKCKLKLHHPRGWRQGFLPLQIC